MSLIDDNEEEEAGDIEPLCEVSKLTMDDWQKRHLQPNEPKPIIRAYYRSVPLADRSAEQDGSSISSRYMSPQRVAIDSHALRDELEEISKHRFAYLPV